MKQFFLTVVTLSMIFSCADKKSYYSISGTYVGAQPGEKVYIQKRDHETKVTTKFDSVEVKDGKYLLKGELKTIAEFELATAYGTKTIVLTDNPLTANITTEEKEGKKGVARMSKFELIGDIEQQHYAEFIRAQTIGMMGTMGVAFMLPKAQAENNQALQDSILEMYVSSLKTQDRLIDSLMDNFKDSYTIAIIIKNKSSKSESFDKFSERYNQLSERIKNSPIGLELKALVAEIGKAAVGQMAPDFTAKTPEGADLSLSSLRGKYVLIDFWASWCSPCIAEVPNVKAVYDEYKSKGFEILSVSLDEDADKWKNAITKHELDWKHISTLKGWNCEIAKQYNVTGVPAMILLDRDGKIVTKDLRGEKLHEEISKLLD